MEMLIVETKKYLLNLSESEIFWLADAIKSAVKREKDEESGWYFRNRSPDFLKILMRRN